MSRYKKIYVLCSNPKFDAHFTTGCLTRIISTFRNRKTTIRSSKIQKIGAIKNNFVANFCIWCFCACNIKFLLNISLLCSRNCFIIIRSLHYACAQKSLTLFPLGGGHGVSLHIQIISFQIWIELHGWKLYDNIISSLLHIWEEWVS